MWESNPPKELFTPITGFEDQGAHQRPSTPICASIVLYFRELINHKNILIDFFYSGGRRQGGESGPRAAEVALLFQRLGLVPVLQQGQGVLAGGPQLVPELRQGQLLSLPKRRFLK